MFSGFTRVSKVIPLVSHDAAVMFQQTRNTYILKRRNPVPLHKKMGRPGKLVNRYFIYDLIEDTNIRKKENVDVVLKEFIEGVGQKGDVVSMHPYRAYNHFLVPGLAAYSTPRNLEKYKPLEEEKREVEVLSSIYVPRTIGVLSRTVIQIIMNKSVPWELEKWHVSASFRKAHFVVPEHAIELPPTKICGPDLSLQEKEFYVTVTINGKEKVNVRCRIHHWATGLERLPYMQDHWKIPRESLFPEQAEVLSKIPLPS